MFFAKRACVTGATGLILSIAPRPNARGAVPRGVVARFPRGAIGLIDRRVLRFQWSPRVSAQKAEHIGGGETESKCEQSFPATMDAGDLFLGSLEDSAAAWDTGPTANLVCPSRLARRNRILERRGSPRVATHSAKARFRLGDSRHAADYPAGIAGNRASPTAFALDADIPALFRRHCVEAPWRRSAGSRTFSRIVGFAPTRGEDTSEGHFILSLVDFRKDPSGSTSRCPGASAAFVHIVQEAPELSGGGFH